MNVTGPYRRIAAFQFKSEATEDQIQTVIDAFKAIVKEFDSLLVNAEHGVDSSNEGHDHGFTHLFIMTFKEKVGAEEYLKHPSHRAFLAKAVPILEKPFVVGFVPAL